MSKELEALDFLGEIYTKRNLQDFPIGNQPKQIVKMKVKNMPEFETIKQALTPPTADEVCKALSEYFKKDVSYNLETKEFICYVEEVLFEYLTETYGDGLWTLSCYLPPHPIKLVGRFYEVQE